MKISENFINACIRKYINENKNYNKHKSRLVEDDHYSGKSIINVDIQPEYQDYLGFNIYEWIDFINENNNDNIITFLYNGNSMGMVSENEYIMWLIDSGIDEDIIDNARFYDKGYAFFRYCMDEGIDEDNIVDLIKFMVRHDINDSRDIDEDMWNQYMEETDHDIDDVRDLLEEADDMVNIPDLMDYLQNYSNIILLGGGINECLKEVEIALQALDKNYNIYDRFTY